MSSIMRKNWLVMRLLEKAIKRGAVEAHGLLLDAGCGAKPYANFFKGRVDKHIGIDVLNSPLLENGVDVFGSVQELPFKDGIFSTVLCSEVLQYSDCPTKVIKELFRVMKKQGILILTTTQMWHVTNPPHDHYRFTEFGLKFLAETAGFSVVEHHALGGFWLRVGLRMCYFFHRFGKWDFLSHIISVLLILPQVFFFAIDTVFFDRKDVIEHAIILVRP